MSRIKEKYTAPTGHMLLSSLFAVEEREGGLHSASLTPPPQPVLPVKLPVAPLILKAF